MGTAENVNTHNVLNLRTQERWTWVLVTNVCLSWFWVTYSHLDICYWHMLLFLWKDQCKY